MSSINSELAKLLSGVDRAGDFYASGTAEIFSPVLEVEGVGVVALPLLPVQVEQLVRVAERAPYGRGEETLYDENVRRTWQIDGERVRLKGRRWEQNLQQIVEQAVEGLGVSQPVRAELYKLLVYGEGDFFVEHRDTEKISGMFATLVIVLPSIYDGGELVVRHRGSEVQLDLKRDDPGDVAFAAFYADCVHEVRPITSGCRLTLIYNLCRIGKGAMPQPPDYQSQRDRIAEVLRQWAEAKTIPDSGEPEKLIYPLEHAYTIAELSFEALKGVDAAAAPVLASAAESADCDFHLALVSIEESGFAEYSGSYGSRYDHSDDDDFEAGDVEDRRAVLSNWIRYGGGPTPMKEIPFDDAELCPPDALGDLEEADVEFHEATGNAGASFERSYQSAAFVLWPRARRLAVLSQGGLRVSLPYLHELVDRWGASSGECSSPEWREADELCGHVLRAWETKTWLAGRNDSDKNSDASKMLALLTRLKAAPRIAAFLTEVSAAGEFCAGDANAIVRAVKLLPSAEGAELIGRIISCNASKALGSCGALLARAARSAGSAVAAARLIAPARILVELMPGDPTREEQTQIWRRTQPVASGFVVDLINALDLIDPALCERALTSILARPKTYDFDCTLVPAALELSGQRRKPETETVGRLRRACQDHLRARIAQPLKPPADWKRNGMASCSCADCRSLNAFLAAPDQKSWPFKAPGDRRSHIEEMVRRNKCDLDMKTETRSRPYTLVCVKNQASYDERVRQQKDDLEKLAGLEESSR